jgi:hypothetical protein
MSSVKPSMIRTFAFQNVRARHARFARQSCRDDDQLRVPEDLRIIAAADRAVEVEVRGHLENVERKPLRDILPDIHECDLAAQLFCCRDLSRRLADAASADDGDFVHVPVP